jgi:predicted CoA-binding protein
MINKNYIYAVIGASNDKQKYGYKVLKDFKESKYEVVPINPKEKEILGLKTYKSILDINYKIDVAIFVVPPKITERVLKEIKKLKINKVWMQPGSESDKAIKYCKDNDINCIHNACVIIRNNK